MERDDHDEILRLRDRVHGMEGDVVALKLLVDDLREWRAEARVKLEGLVSAQEIADRVAEKLREEDDDKVTIGNFKLTRWQTRIAAAALLAAIAAPYIEKAIP